MSSTILAGAYAGLAAGAIMTFLAHVAPYVSAGNFIRDVDQPTVFGKLLSRREAHLLGVLIHLVLSMIFGLGFAVGIAQGWVSGFQLLPMLGWSVILFLFTGLVVMPSEGHGLFGVRHDAWFPVDLLLTNIGWGLVYFALIRLWLPV